MNKLAHVQPSQILSPHRTQDARSGNVVYGAAARENISKRAPARPTVLYKNAAAYYDKKIHFDQPLLEYDSGSNPLLHRQNTIADSAYIQSKKEYAVETYFRDLKFTGAPEQSLDNLIRDFEICATQQCFDRTQMSLFFISAVADPAKQLFLMNRSSRMVLEI